MTEMTTITTKTYYIGYNFYIDVVDNFLNNYYEAWIWNESYGIKDHMFSIPGEKQAYKEFLEIVRNNADKYMIYYVDDHFTYDERREFYAQNNILQSN